MGGGHKITSAVVELIILCFTVRRAVGVVCCVRAIRRTDMSIESDASVLSPSADITLSFPPLSRDSVVFDPAAPSLGIEYNVCECICLSG